LEEAEPQLSNMGKNDAKKDESPSQLIDKRIQELGDWRGETLAKVRQLSIILNYPTLSFWIIIAEFTREMSLYHCSY
jgi:hypothetical protein